MEPQKPKKRSPLKDRPLRGAGQSVSEMIDDSITDAALLAAAPFLAIYIALNEWWRSYRHDTFHPIAFGIVAILTSAFCVWRFTKIWKRIKLLKLGRDGERIVAEFLDPMRKTGFEILHDVVGGDFNVDHVLIGPQGVFVIETKTRSKSGGQEETVQFDGTDIFIHGFTADPNPLIQAKANVRWIKELLKSSTSKDFPVIPVVLSEETVERSGAVSSFKHFLTGLIVVLLFRVDGELCKVLSDNGLCSVFTNGVLTSASLVLTSASRLLTFASFAVSTFMQSTIV